MDGSGTVPVPLCGLSLYTFIRFYTLFYTLNLKEYGCTVYLTAHPVLYLTGRTFHGRWGQSLPQSSQGL